MIKDDKLWLGYGFASGNAFFKIPVAKSREFAAGVYDSKTGLVKFRNVGWFTNLHVDKSEDPITPYLTYEQGRKKGLYPKYDNYDAIEVSKVAEIPSDYKGVMGVPITFLDKWVPESGIEIVKFRKGNDDKDLAFTRERESTTVLQNTHSLSSGKRESLNQMESVLSTKRDGHTSRDRGSMRDYSSNKFEILGIANSARWIGYELYTIIDGRKIYNRIIIKRRQ